MLGRATRRPRAPGSSFSASGRARLRSLVRSAEINIASRGQARAWRWIRATRHLSMVSRIFAAWPGRPACGPGRSRGPAWGSSEIRFARLRDEGVPVVIKFALVFGADELRPGIDGGPIGDGRGPGRGKDAFIFDRKMELQNLATVIGIEVPTTAGVGIFFGVAFHRVFGSVVIDEPVAFHHVQL